MNQEITNSLYNFIRYFCSTILLSNLFLIRYETKYEKYSSNTEPSQLVQSQNCDVVL